MQSTLLDELETWEAPRSLRIAVCMKLVMPLLKFGFTVYLSPIA